MTTRIAPMPDPQIDAREDVFTALIVKEVRQIIRKIQAQLRAPITAAAAQQPATTPTPIPLAQAEATTLDSWQIFVETTAFPFVVDSMVESASLVVEQMTSATGLVIEPITNDYATEYLQTAKNRMVNVGQGLWANIRSELVAGSEAGESIAQISARLAQFPQMSESRAHTVARTEVISALNAGSYIQMIDYDLGTDVHKEWLATEDPRTRLSHKHADNQSVLLVDEFTVDIYSDAVKIGTEQMEFPGDPTATPGNVINCRCSLGYSFNEDEILTAAAGDFIEAEHPRDNHGKFAEKPGVHLPDLGKLTDNQYKSFVKGLTQNTWDKYSKNQQDSIIKRSESLGLGDGNATVDKLFTLFKNSAPKAPAAPAKKARPLGGIDNTSGKPVKPDKPVMLRVKALFGTTYENGAIVAVKPDSNERIIWQDKKMVRQTNKDGKWQTTESLTRGAMMQKYKDEEGWRTPSAQNTATTTTAAPAAVKKAASAAKPIKLKVNVLYNKTYADGDVVAERPFSDERIVWNAKTKKLDRQFRTADGNWVTAESFTRGAAYAKYKDEDGWYTPGALGESYTPPQKPSAPSPPMQEPVKIAPEPSQAVLPDQGPEIDPETGKFTKLVKLTATWNGQTETRTTKNPYKFAAVVKFSEDHEGTIVSWHRTYEGASKGTLTGTQKQNGVKVIAVVPVEWPGVKEESLPASKYPLDKYKTSVSNPEVKVGKLLDEVGTTDNTIIIRKGFNGTITLHNEIGAKRSLDVDGLNDDKIDSAIGELTLQKMEAQDKAQDISKHGVSTLKKALNDPDIPTGEVLLSQPGPNGSQLRIRKSGTKRIRLEYIDKDGALITPDEFLMADEITDDKIDAIFAKFSAVKIVPKSLQPTGNLPSPGNLTFTGKIVGTHHGKIYKDQNGTEWLFKADIPHKPFSFAAVVTANIHQRVGLTTPETGIYQLEGKTGSLQRIIPSTEPFGYKFDPGSLSTKDTLAMQKEQVFDWLVSNHDSHAKNFLKDKNGDIFGIDKDQAFRWLGGDSLNWDFQPNEHPQAAYRLWKSYASGDTATQVINPSQPGPLRSFIENIQNMPDAEYRELVRPYAERAAKLDSLGKQGPAYLGLKYPGFQSNDVEGFLDAAVARKNNLLKDFANLYSNAYLTREKALAEKGGVPPTPPVAALAPQAGIKPKSTPFKFSADVLIGKTSTTYTHGQVIAEKPGNGTAAPARLIWDAVNKKFVLQGKMDPNANKWTTAIAFNKQAAFKAYKDAPGWFTPLETQDSSGGPSAGLAPAPSVHGAPVAKAYTAPKPKAVKKPKFTVEELQAQASEHGLIGIQKDALYYTFRNYKNKLVKTSSPGSLQFQALLSAVNLHNDKNPGQKQTLLSALRAIDERASAAFLENKHLFEKSVVAWLGTPSGKANAQKYIDESKLTAAEKEALQTAKVDKKFSTFADIKLSQPHTGPATFEVISPADAKAMQVEMGEWTPAQRMSLKSYTGSSYTEINGTLRKTYGYATKTPSPTVLNHAKNIQSAMKPVSRDILVYRGTSATPDLPQDIDKMKALVGKTFVDKGFMSTSVGYRSGSIRLIIEVPKGTPAAYVQSISQHPSEQELLLAAGLRFEILSAELASNNFGIDVRARVVPNE